MGKPQLGLGFDSAINDCASYYKGDDWAALTGAFELADGAISTEHENYYFLFRAAKWALENAPTSEIDSWDSSKEFIKTMAERITFDEVDKETLADLILKRKRGVLDTTLAAAELNAMLDNFEVEI